MTNQRSADTRNAGTFLALFGLMAVSAALLALVAMVLPQVLGLFSVFLGFALFASFNYVVWGYWLSRSMQRDESDSAGSSDSPKPSDRDE